MIQIKLKYIEGSIVAALQNKHYLLEAIVETELEAKPFPYMVRDAIRSPSLLAVRREFITHLQTHRPVEIISFRGYRKFSADWWVANLRLEPVVPFRYKEEVSFLILGWSSVKFGTKAVVIKAGDVKSIEEEVKIRSTEKEGRGYVEEFVLENVELRTGILDLPEIPGLPKIEEIEEKGSFSKILSGGSTREKRDPEPTPEPEPEPSAAESVIEKHSLPETLLEVLRVEDMKCSPEDSPEGIDLMDPDLSHSSAKKVLEKKKGKELSKKKKLREIMKQRKAESDW